MNASTNLAIVLEQLARSDSELLADVRAARHTEQAVERIMGSARQNSMNVDAQALTMQMDTLRILAELTEREPALLNQMAGGETSAENIERIQKLAQSHGFDLNVDALALLTQDSSTQKSATELSDSELMGVAGGSVPATVIGNVVVWGIRMGLIPDPMPPVAPGLR